MREERVDIPDSTLRRGGIGAMVSRAREWWAQLGWDGVLQLMTG
jgi:hypothetical protein